MTMLKEKNKGSTTVTRISDASHYCHTACHTTLRRHRVKRNAVAWQLYGQPARRCSGRSHPLHLLLSSLTLDSKSGRCASRLTSRLTLSHRQRHAPKLMQPHFSLTTSRFNMPSLPPSNP